MKGRWIRRWIGASPFASAPGSATAQVAPSPRCFSRPADHADRAISRRRPERRTGAAVAQGMSTHLKQSIVVENIAGASGTIGLARLVNAAPDGYTIGFGTIGTHVANAALYKKLPYDPLPDFAPIGLAGTAPTMLVAQAVAAASQSAGIRRLRGRNRATA